MSEKKTPKVYGFFGFRGTLVVPECPYCGGRHRHRQARGPDSYQRLADCFGGEYVIVFNKQEANNA